MHPGKKEHKDNLIVAYLVLSMNNKFYEISEKNKCPDRSKKLVYSSTKPIIYFFRTKGCTFHQFTQVITNGECWENAKKICKPCDLQTFLMFPQHPYGLLHHL